MTTDTPTTYRVLGMDLAPLSLTQIGMEFATTFIIAAVFASFFTFSPVVVVFTFYAGCLRQCGGKAFSGGGLVLLAGLTVLTSVLWAAFIGPDFFPANFFQGDYSGGSSDQGVSTGMRVEDM